MCKILGQTKKTRCFSGIPGRAGIDEGGNCLVICTDAICREAITKKSIDDWLFKQTLFCQDWQLDCFLSFSEEQLVKRHHDQFGSC